MICLLLLHLQKLLKKSVPDRHLLLFSQGLITSGASTEDSIGNRYQAGHEDEIMAQVGLK